MLLALLGLLALLAPAASSGSRQSPSLGVSHVQLSSSWKESWLTADVSFSVTVGDATTVTAFVRPAAGGPIGAKKDFVFAHAGTVTETLALPHRLAPKLYLLRVLGKSGTSGLPAVDSNFTLPAPPEGIVDLASISRTQGGATVHVVQGPISKIWARFHFVNAPAGKTVTIVWRTPSYKYVGEVTKPYTSKVDSFLGSSAALSRGVWYAILSVDGKPAKRVDVRVT